MPDWWSGASWCCRGSTSARFARREPHRCARGGLGLLRDGCSRGGVSLGDPGEAEQKGKQHPERERGGGVRPVGRIEDLSGEGVEGEARVKPGGGMGEEGQ